MSSVLELRAGLLVQLEQPLTTIDGVSIVAGTVLRVRYVSDRLVSLGCPGLESVGYQVRRPLPRDSFYILRCTAE